MAESVDERREHPRLKLELNVVFTPHHDDPQQPKMEYHGETVNISAGGVCIDTPEWRQVRIDDRLSLRISGFSRYGTGTLFREMRGSGIVVRFREPEAEPQSSGRAMVALRFAETPRFDVYDWVD